MKKTGKMTFQLNDMKKRIEMKHLIKQQKIIIALLINKTTQSMA